MLRLELKVLREHFPPSLSTLYLLWLICHLPVGTNGQPGHSPMSLSLGKERHNS